MPTLSGIIIVPYPYFGAKYQNPPIVWFFFAIIPKPQSTVIPFYD